MPSFYYAFLVQINFFISKSDVVALSALVKTSFSVVPPLKFTYINLMYLLAALAPSAAAQPFFNETTMVLPYLPLSLPRVAAAISPIFAYDF